MSLFAKPADAHALEIAAVDLGSNSFHMMVARAAGDDIQVIDRLREPVRLAAGLDADKRLSREAQERALACLERFGERLRGIPRSRVRVVGTNTLRKMKKGGEFIAAAEKALGHGLEIISGLEEARLVYAGVTHGMDDERRLVVDIGGGSTELVIGKGRRPELLESVALGCVVHTQKFFGDGEITRARFKRARIAARVELEFLERRYRKLGWDQAIGASGTVRGVWRVLMAQKWCQDEITLEGIERLIELLCDRGQIGRIDFPALREDRRPVFPGGLAVLAGVFDALGLERMGTSESALREGLVYDLLGRLSHRDVRDAAVTALARRFGVDLRHARDVERTALKLLDQVARDWKLDDPEAALRLQWAARLHEAGLVVAHAGYHKHSEYLLRHADLAGFSDNERALLAALVRLHRGKFAPAAWQGLPPDGSAAIQRLAVLLRVAVLLHRGRVGSVKPRFTATAGRNALELQFARGWLDKHPLTRADLELEADYLRDSELKLRFE